MKKEITVEGVYLGYIIVSVIGILGLLIDITKTTMYVSFILWILIAIIGLVLER